MDYKGKLKEFIVKLLDNIHEQRKLILALSCVVVFVTTYVLILPAFTLEKTEAAKQGGIDVPGVEQAAAADPDGEAEAADEANAAPASKAKEAKTEKAAKEPKQTKQNNGSSDITLQNDESEDYIVAVEGKDDVLSEDMSVNVREIDRSTKKLKKEYDSLYSDALEAVQKEEGSEKPSTFAFAKFYDISLMDGDTETEPADAVDVKISFSEEMQKELKVSDPERLHIVHFAVDKETGKTTPEVLDPETTDITVEKNKVTEAAFTADSFSVFAVVYTVDFHYEVDGKKYDYSMDGGSYISLAQIVKALKVNDDSAAFITNIEKVEFSDPELVWVGKVEEDTTVGALKEANGLKPEYSANLTKEQIAEEDAKTVKAGDWALISLKPFDTEETLTVTMKNGDGCKIGVTDASGDILKSTDEIIYGNRYLIYTVSNGQYQVLNPGNGGYYSVPNNNLASVPDSYYWIFDNNNGALQIHNNAGDYVPIRNESAQTVVSWRKTASSAIVAYDGYDSGFKIYGSQSGVNYYIGWNNGFKISTTTPCRIRLYGQANKRFNFTVKTEDPSRGLVSGKQADGTEVTNVESFQSATKNKGNDGKASLNYYVEAKPMPGYRFLEWTLNGRVVSTDQRLNSNNTVGMFSANNQTLMAVFEEDPAYHQDDPASGITISPDEQRALQEWLESLDSREPLQNVTKTARAYDYQNRIYEVDITAESAIRDFYSDIDLGFILDASGSMKFPSSLIKVEGERFPMTQDNLNEAFPEGGRYYIISDPKNTSTVYEIYANSGYYGNWTWTWKDASFEDSERKAITGSEKFADYTTGPGLAYQLYRDENEGQANQKRVNYLNSSLTNAIGALKRIVAHTGSDQGDSSADVNVGYNTFFYKVDSHEDFQSLKNNPNLSVQVGNVEGGTSQDIALDDARTLSWDRLHNGNQKYAILITDGAAVYNKNRPKFTEYTTSEAIQDNVRTQAGLLKNDGVTLITIGLSTKNVDGGSNLLYEIASDIDGTRQFYEAEKGEDLYYILLHILQTILTQADVSGYVTDEIDPAFYPVDIITGKPLSAGDKINLNGKLTTDTSKPYGIVEKDISGNYRIRWSNQTFGWKDKDENWKGKLYVKAKEDFLGGNTISTNKEAEIVAQSFTITDSNGGNPKVHHIGDVRTALKTPYVNVNELEISKNNTKWTLYDKTETAPKDQIKALFDNVSFREVITDSGDLVYGTPLENLTQNRQKVNTPGTELTLREVLGLSTNAEYDSWYEDLISSGSKEILYCGDGAYGHGTAETPVGKINISVSKSGETSDYYRHEVSGGKKESYKLLITYTPTDETTATGAISEIDTNKEDPYHNGSGSRGSVTDSLTSQNTHTINVVKKMIEITKVDGAGNPITGNGNSAQFTIYRTAKNGEPVATDSRLPEGNFTAVTTITTDPATGKAKWDPIEAIKKVDNTGWMEASEFLILETQAPGKYSEYDKNIPMTLTISESTTPVLTSPDGMKILLYNLTQTPEVSVTGDNTAGYVTDIVESDDTVSFNVRNDLSTDLDIIKTDNASTPKSIGGAVFTLTKDHSVLNNLSVISKLDDSSIEVDQTTGQFVIPEGGVTIKNLTGGEYVLKEVSPPDGYIKTIKDVEFSVNSVGAITDKENALNDGKVEFASKTYMIQNEPGAELPHTGGIGTAIFYILGLAFTLFGGAGLMIRKRKKSA